MRKILSALFFFASVSVTFAQIGPKPGSGGGGTPGGSSGQLQYNSSGSFGGLNGLTAMGLTPYVSGKYYLSWPSVWTNQGQIYATGTVYCRVAYFKGQATLDTIGATLTGAVASGNFQIGIYAVDATTQLPTGNALATTAPISTASNSSVVGAVNSGTPIQLGSVSNALTPYGFCIMVDATAGGAASFNATPNTGTGMAADVGSSSANGAMNSSGNGLGSASLGGQTYGTWPNLTAASFSLNNFGGVIPVFHLSSVP